MKKLILFVIVSLSIGVYSQQKPQIGKGVNPKSADQKKLDAFKGQVKGKIVWSTSRVSQHHDIWIMNADGSGKKALTKTDKVDWYARFSPDGTKVLFTRSKLDWTGEMDVKYPERWETWVINSDGSGEKKLVDNATWATWRPSGEEIVFARGKDVLICDANGQNEKIIVEGDKHLDGGIAQNPNLSDDGKYMAITLRGSKRETGILNMETKKWFTSGKGCQINFFPGTNRVFRMNPTGNGGTQIYAFDITADGTHGSISGTKMKQDDGKKVNIKFMDLPGRRSHEYFPKTDQKGQYLVWAATAKGHDHDIVDYEIHIWKIGDDMKNAVRLTYHTGNDRWPDLHL